MKHHESKLQSACVRWFRYNLPSIIIASIPNGGYRNMVTASIMKAEGALAGMPDLVILRPSQGFCGLFIEMKSETGRLSKSQTELHRRLIDEGYQVAICRTFDEFQLVVKKYLDIHN